MLIQADISSTRVIWVALAAAALLTTSFLYAAPEPRVWQVLWGFILVGLWARYFIAGRTGAWGILMYFTWLLTVRSISALAYEIYSWEITWSGIALMGASVLVSGLAWSARRDFTQPSRARIFLWALVAVAFGVPTGIDDARDSQQYRFDHERQLAPLPVQTLSERVPLTPDLQRTIKVFGGRVLATDRAYGETWMVYKRGECLWFAYDFGGSGECQLDPNPSRQPSLGGMSSENFSLYQGFVSPEVRSLELRINGERAVAVSLYELPRSLGIDGFLYVLPWPKPLDDPFDVELVAFDSEGQLLE